MAPVPKRERAQVRRWSWIRRLVPRPRAKPTATSAPTVVRTAATSVQGTLAEVGVATNNSETVLSAVREMTANAKAAAELLDGLLDYARLESGADTPSVAPLDLSRLVSDIVAASTAAASRKGICLRSSVPAGLVVRVLD